MDFLRRLFSGGGGGASDDPHGLYFYVRPNGCDEVVRLRVNRLNDLSQTDDGNGYWVHKVVRGVKCRQQVELDLYFDSNRKHNNTEAKGGVMVTVSDYEAWIGAESAPQG